MLVQDDQVYQSHQLSTDLDTYRWKPDTIEKRWRTVSQFPPLKKLTISRGGLVHKKGENIINPNYFILQDKLVKKLFEDLKKVKYSHSFPNGYDLMISM